MMTFQAWILYLTLVVIATATPGPAVLFITSSSLSYGWKKTMFSAFGNIVGLLLLGILAISGLGAILKSSIALYAILKWFGAMYLVYLGVKMFMKKEDSNESPSVNSRESNISPIHLFSQSLIIAMSNPKAIVFLTALFPQFIVVNNPLFPQFMTLITVLMGFSFFFLMSYSLLADKAKYWINRGSRRKTLADRVCGSLFISFGIMLATSSNK